MAARCEKYDLPAEMCAHCTGAEARARAEQQHAEIMPGTPWFRASWPGRCSGRGEEIVPGDTIRADGHGGYVCEDCGAADALEELY
jgi:hypothetical protein